MNFGFVDFLTLLGSLGIFLFGMKLMSDSLQKVSGEKLGDYIINVSETIKEVKE